MHEPSLTTVCRVCGTAFFRQGDGFGEVCVGCLLGAALTGGDDSENVIPVDAVPSHRVGLEAHGARFAHYEISTRSDRAFEELGRGAMGVTYRAVDTVLHHAVALKVVAPEVAGNPKARARFLREAQAAASLRHPHVASVFFFGERPVDRQLFYAMELIEGETLQAQVAKAGGLPVDTVVEIGIQVASALAAAEARGLTHRDLKPANVMLSEGEKVNAKIIDFGLARTILGEPNGATRQTQAGEFVGTPAFASPEHFNVWQDTDARSDFYALGATLWYALTGRVPFAGRTPEEVRDRQLHSALPLEQLRAARVPRPVVELLRSLLSADPTGRPQTARALNEALARCRVQAAATIPKTRLRTKLLVTAALGSCLAVAGGSWFLREGHRLPVPSLPAPDKSIAVLPFDNLSAGKDDAFFADGVQGEILTDLAKVADLKVISRTSVMQYRGNGARNLRDIAVQLGVAHVVEGSVQRAGNEVRVNAQLIDARTDAHEWAANYDKTLDNVFTVQTEVAQAIAEQLRAHISPEEHILMAEVPTKDALALQLYQQAAELAAHEAESDARDGLLQAVDLLEQAVKRDPGFLQAHCLLSRVHLALYWEGFDHTDARREAGHAALAQAVRLGPNAGETHVAQAVFAYHGFRDYDRALAELALARRSLPNSAEIAFTRALIYRRQGQWDESVREFEQAATLDPRNFETLQETGNTYAALRREADAARFYLRALAVVPGDIDTREWFAQLAFSARADIGPLRALHAAIVTGGKPAELASSAAYRLLGALEDRDADTAQAALASLPTAGTLDTTTNVFLPKEWFAGLSADIFGDSAVARINFAAAREKMDRQVRAQPDYADAWSALGRIDALLGRDDDALREGRRACELLPVAKDAFNGPAIASNLAAIYARTGRKDLALQELDGLVHLKGGNDSAEISYGGLKLNPRWEPLRGDPRFAALMAAVAPKP